MASQPAQVVPSSTTTAPSTAGASLSASVASTSSNSSVTTTPVTITSSIVDELMEENCSDDGLPQSDPNRWFFTKEQLENTPSRRAGIETDKELMYRQQSANFIQDIGQRLQVNQLCINTAIVYMHRFYMFHPFTVYHRNSISTAAVFLAAKVEEQPRKLEYVIKVAHYCLFRDSQPPIDLKSEAYANLATELVSNENILLQTLGFDVGIDHPHTHVVKCCQLVRASKDLAQTSYFMATNSLHLTTMSLEYKSSVVACVCIHLACKWSNWEIPRSKEGKDWFWYVDGAVTIEQLEQYTNEFLTIFNKSPSRLKKKIISLSAATRGNSGNLSAFPSHFNLDPSSPGMPQFSKSRSPSPSESANAGKLRLPPKSNAPQPLFSQIRPMVKPGVPGPGQQHPVSKPHPVGSGHPHTAPLPPIYRQNAHGGSAHAVPAKAGHPYPSGSHPAPAHGDLKNPQKPGGQFASSGYHPAPSGGSQNSHQAGTIRSQPVHQNNAQPSSHLPTGSKPGAHPPAVQGGNSAQHGVNANMNTQNQRQLMGGPPQPKPHLNSRPSAPQPPVIRPLMGSLSQSLKRPYPTELQQRSEVRPDLMAKRDVAPRFPPPQNHVGIVGLSQAQIRPVNPIRPRLPEKQEIRHPLSQPATVPATTHQTQQTHGTTGKLPAAVDGRPWMDRFLDNEIQISHSDQPSKPPVVASRPPQLSQLHVSSSSSGHASMQQPTVHSGSTFHVSSTSSAVPIVTTSAPSLSSSVPSLMPIPPNALTLTLTPTPSLASSSISSESVGSEKRKKEKKHKKDKHRDKEEKKHKHKEKHKKEHKEKHKEKHKPKHRPSEDFTIDAGNNKLKIIIGRNPNAAAQDPKDSNSKSSKHSKDHHTATIINY